MRTLLVLFLLCFIGLHAALPSAALADEPVKIASFLSDDGTDGDGEQPASPDAKAACHDSCSWLANWYAPEIREPHRSLTERRTRAISSGLPLLVVPPPR